MNLRFFIAFAGFSCAQGLLAWRLLGFIEGQPLVQGLTLLFVLSGAAGIALLLRRHLPLQERSTNLAFIAVPLLAFAGPVMYLALSFVSYYTAGVYLSALFLSSFLFVWAYPPAVQQAGQRQPFLLRWGWWLVLFISLPALRLPLADSFRLFVPVWLLLSLLFGLSPKGVSSGIKGIVLIVAATFALASLHYVGQQPFYTQQERYEDRVIYAQEHPGHQLVVTRWRDGHYLYLNGQKQVSTFDDYLFYEPMVHPAMLLHGEARRVLLIGGETGGSLRELLRYEHVRVDVVLNEPAYRQHLARLPWINDWNEQAFRDKRVRIDGRRLRDWLARHKEERAHYDVIIVDLPDPETLGQSAWYSQEFYAAMGAHLTEEGVLVTQATSPYFATRAFHCIDTTVQAAGFQTLPLHNQIMTLGEWGWILASKTQLPGEMQARLDTAPLPPSCRWLNTEAMQMLSRFGKPVRQTEAPAVNTLEDPVLLSYYLKGNWRF